MASRQTKQTLGTPYQIYSEIANAGKNLASTKRRVSWRFGWSEGEGDHEITLVHSIVSGKKVIFEDGREVVTSSSMMSKDFTHGWNSSNYIFRVEVDGRVEHDYVFSIDGVPFAQMQRKRDVENNRDHSNDSHQEKKTLPVNSTPPRKSNTPFAKNNSENKAADEFRSSFQSPKTGKNDTFDPFGTSSGASDPFGERSQITPSRSEVSLLDEEGIAPPQIIQSNVFDPFGSSPDPFGENPKKKSAQDFSNDFAGLSFAVAPPPPNPAFNQDTQHTADNLFDDEEPFSAAPVTKTPTKEVWTAPKSLVNLDFNAPPAASTSNAFSGRSPSLNLLLNGSNTRVQGANGLNAPTPPRAPMNNGNGSGTPINNNQGMQGGMRGGPGPMGGQGQMGGGMQNNSPMGNNPNLMGNNGNGMGMGQNQGQGMHQQHAPQYGMGLNQPMSQGGQMGGGGGMAQMGGQGQGSMQQGQGMNQMQGNNMGMGMSQQGQGMGQQGMGGMSGGTGMMSGGVANNRLMMSPGMGMGSGMQGSSPSTYLASTSGATSSLTGSSLARGVKVAGSGPKSSLDDINWKM